MTFDPSNRRRHQRFPISEYEIFLGRKGGFLSMLLGGHRKNVAIGVGDMSESGMRLGVRRRLPVGSHVVIRCDLKTLNDALALEGTVVWCVPHFSRRREYIVGVTFTNADASVQRKIASIRSYITSPHFKAKQETRVRRRAQGLSSRPGTDE